jgi:hypothetical protein
MSFGIFSSGNALNGDGFKLFGLDLDILPLADFVALHDIG